MVETAIIGGTGLTSMEGLEVTRREMVRTPYGAPSGPVLYGLLGDVSVVFMARHGHLHTLPPHQINYCANIWALHSVGVKRIIGVGAVSGIADNCKPGTLVIPDQLIDYTTGRNSTFFDGGVNHPVTHVRFTQPYSESLRQQLLSGARAAGVDVVSSGTYGVTQGPRMSTKAEVDRMAKDGCTVTGMTAMPEAVLARELELEYASCAVVVGRAEVDDSDDTLATHVEQGMASVRALIAAAVGSQG